MELGSNRKQIYVVIGLIAGTIGAAALGFIASVMLTGGFSPQNSKADQIALIYQNATYEQLPPTVDLATAAGWSGSIRCVFGQGRFYQKRVDDATYPLMLIYNPDGLLVGFQLHSVNEQPEGVWQHIPDGIPSTMVENLEFEHWRTGLYIVNPLKACKIPKGGCAPAPQSGFRSC